MDRIHVELLEGETQRAVAVASFDRTDLVPPGIGDGHHAFSIDLKPGLLSDGKHTLHLRCAVTGAPVPGSPFVIEPSSEARLRPFRYHLDEISDQGVAGWIAPANGPLRHCSVVLKEGGTVLARAVAAQFRPDLLSAGIGDGCYAFTLSMPLSLLDGETHLLGVVEEDTGFALSDESIPWRSAPVTPAAAPADVGGAIGDSSTDDSSFGPSMPKEDRNIMLASIDTGHSEVAPVQARCSIDALLIAPNLGLMIVGWIDDVSSPLSCIRITSSGWRTVIDASRFIRVRRTDVEKALGSRAAHLFGFLGFLHFDRGGDASGPIKVELWQRGGLAPTVECVPTLVGDVDLRNTVLAYLASASFFGNPAFESMSCLGQGVGAELVRLNKAITSRVVATPFVERFGLHKKTPRGTIIVCLYGKPEFYFVQNCLFSGLPGIDEYEFVYVSNSPEMAETLLREAQAANLVYGLTSSVMILTGNAGFGAANNVAARIARSDRLLIVNPDVFPRDLDWAKKHSSLLETAPSEQTRLFGVPLYYDDGSLMHGGMHFEVDIGLSISKGAPVAQKVCRVEHYGKGAPPGSSQFTHSRQVPAVSGAFISVERSWFEKLGGFTEDFIFGHYEDADLCLKSIEKGVVPWLQDIRMWHLEGNGSTRQLPHEGGSLVNRWLFSQTWMRTIEAGLKGPSPSHALLRAPSPTASGEHQARQPSVASPAASA
jgi:GT2 family glycosyltransferase